MGAWVAAVSAVVVAALEAWRPRAAGNVQDGKANDSSLAQSEQQQVA